MATTEVVWTTKNEDRAVAIAVASAARALRLGTKKTPAAIFDIDETLLRNRDDDRVTVQSAGRRMYEWAAANGVAIYLVTARRKSPNAFEYAKKQLSELGYDLSAVRKVYMVNQEYDEDEDAGARFKRTVRKRLAQTHSIVLNAGDRWGDITLSDRRPKGAPKETRMYMGVVSGGETDQLQGIKFPRKN